MNLFGYIISGNTVGTDLSGWSVDDLNGNEPFVVSTATTVSGYGNITSIENWSKFGSGVLSDYQDKQKSIRLAGYNKGWGNCTVSEKDILTDYYANPQINQTGSTQNTEVITHLMTTRGMSQVEATDYIVDRWWDHWTKFLQDCDNRWRRGVKISIQYLSFADASDLFDEIEKLVGYYLNSGRLGKDYGDSRDGIMDFIMSTNMYNGNGLEENAYTLKKGTWTDFKNELETALVSDYFWPELKTHINNLM